MGRPAGDHPGRVVVREHPGGWRPDRTCGSQGDVDDVALGFRGPLAHQRVEVEGRATRRADATCQLGRRCHPGLGHEHPGSAVGSSVRRPPYATGAGCRAHAAGSCTACRQARSRAALRSLGRRPRQVGRVPWPSSWRRRPETRRPHGRTRTARSHRIPQLPQGSPSSSPAAQREQVQIPLPAGPVGIGGSLAPTAEHGRPVVRRGAAV